MKIQLGEDVKMALGTLRENKMRSFLTVLGVVIGITALLSVVSILVGVYSNVTAMMNDYGPDTLFVFRFDPGIHTGRLSPDELSRKSLTLDDAEAIDELCPAVKMVSASIFPRFDPTAQQPPVDARYHDKEVDGVNFSGTLPETEQVFNEAPSRGRFFTEAENMHRSDVALIGSDIAKGLFPGGDALGKSVVVAGDSYQVIGVLEPRKGLLQAQSANEEVLVPYRTYQKHHAEAPDNFIGAVAFPGKMSEAQDEIRGLLRRRRHVAWDKPDNFGISSAQAIADQFKQITSSVALLIAVISSIGLLVGGVGVMNIMLMSVTQRTREIGVRKAIGARRRDIVWQFLTEAVVLTGAGGVIGVLMGLLISFTINALLPKLPSAVPLWSIVLAVGVSMSVGLFFGMYPAIKAARLDPVVALRYE
ncbi:MAG TPA: ABC transporter permease [Candidatus Acidoferrum sp.]|nr:ABC transporter permease [Candidatus Acidoferrum sp.]